MGKRRNRTQNKQKFHKPESIINTVRDANGLYKKNDVNSPRSLRNRYPMLYFVLILCIIAVLAEIFVFNAKSFKPRGDVAELDIGKAGNIGFKYDSLNGYWIGAEGERQLEFTDINSRVDTLFLDMFLDSAVKQTVRIDVADATSAAYRMGLAQITIIRNAPDSKFITCQFSGDVKSLRLHFDVPDNQKIVLYSISINQAIPFRFHAIRFLSIVFIAITAYALLRLQIFQRAYKTKTIYKAIIYGLTFIFIMLALGLTLAYRQGKSISFAQDFKSTSGDQITQELVDAFRAGQISLLDLPPQDLLKLDNPYDDSERARAGVQYKWDHLLYNGKYYSYYGVAPVLLLFLPYTILTGYYFPTPWAVFIFGAIGIYFLSLLLITITRRFFPELPFGLVVMGLVIVQAASGIWVCFSSPLFYEIAQSSAFMFVIIGAYLLLSARLQRNRRLTLARMFFGNAALALVVMCRPTNIVYIPVALVFLWFDQTGRIDPVDRYGKRISLNVLLAVIIPYAFFGGIQMLYNYTRFGSIFDFGIQYSLTINDFTNAQFHIRMALIGFYNFLFAFPQLKPQFPFIFSQYSTLDINGYYFTANSYAVGILFRSLPVFYLFSAGSVYRLLPDARKLSLSLSWFLFCVVAPFVIIFSYWQSGYGYRYCADFSWQIIIGAFILLFFHYIRQSDERKRQTYRMALAYTFSSVAVNSAISISYMEGLLSVNAHTVFLQIARIFEFWK